jgi:hypothetical protein
LEEKDYNKLFSLLVKKFDLHKKQSTTDIFIKKGEISALGKIATILENQIKGKYLEKQRKLKSYKDDETSMKKFDLHSFGSKNAKEVYTVLQLTNANIAKEKSLMNQTVALEKLFEILDGNVEQSLRELDMYKVIEENKSNLPKDVEIRMGTGKCALKRPGRVKFPCDNELVPGEKYCKEHLKQFNPERYYELFEETEDKE